MIENLFPTSSLVGRAVPKKTFVEQLGANARMKEHFTRDVGGITWLAKLAPSTINVADGTVVHEIAVFHVAVKAKDCPVDVFAFIDTWLPRHTLFVLECGDRASLLIHYKEPSQGTTGQRYRIVRAYRSDWQATDDVALTLQGPSMDTIYENLVRQIAAEQITSPSPNLRQAIDQTAQQEALQREIAALEKRIAAERQPQKKFKLHQQLLTLKKKIQFLIPN